MSGWCAITFLYGNISSCPRKIIFTYFFGLFKVFSRKTIDSVRGTEVGHQKTLKSDQVGYNLDVDQEDEDEYDADGDINLKFIWSDIRVHMVTPFKG